MSDAVPDLWDYAQSARYVRIGVRMLRRLVAAGDGPPTIRIGRCVRFAKRDIDAWIAVRTSGVIDQREAYLRRIVDLIPPVDGEIRARIVALMSTGPLG